MPQCTDRTPSHQVRWISNFEIFMVREVFLLWPQHSVLGLGEQAINKRTEVEMLKSPGRPSSWIKRSGQHSEWQQLQFLMVNTDNVSCICYVCYNRNGRCHLPYFANYAQSVLQRRGRNQITSTACCTIIWFIPLFLVS